MLVSPNPVFTGTLNIKIIAAESVKISINLTAAVTGTIANEQAQTTVSGENTFSIDVSGLPKGVYNITVRCVNGQGLSTKMVTVL